MTDKKNDDCGVKNSTSQGYIKLKPLYYGLLQMSDDRSTIPRLPSISTTYVEPIGRKELATTWWESCPNQCMAHLPSNKPCAQYCKSLRKHVSILSKKMITTNLISNWSDEREKNNNERYIRDDRQVKSHQKRILMKHPIAVQKQQSDLIHITPIHQLTVSSRHASSVETIYYNLRIGKDKNQPWMQFHVSIDQPRSKFIPFTTLRNCTTSPKRKLDFHADNEIREETYSVQTKRNRSATRTSSLDDGSSALQYNDTHRITTSKPTLSERWDIPNSRKYPKNDHWLADSSHDILLYHSEESEGTIETVGKHFISTQQLISKNTTNATPNDASKRVPHVTPGTTASSKTVQVSCKESNNEGSSVHNISSPRQLFPMDTFVLNKHCERLFPDEFIERNDNKSLCPSNLVDQFLVDNDNTNSTNNKHYVLSEQDNDDDDDDESNEEQYATYLSLPQPESFVPSPLHNDAELSHAQPTYNSSINGTMKTSTSNALEECPSRTKVVDLSYHDWRNLKTGLQPTSTSRFRQTMIELILMRNELDDKKQELDPTKRKQLWLPSLFNKDTILSSSWKFSKYA